MASEMSSHDASGHDTAAYYALIEKLIADQVYVWGKPAIDIADSIQGLAVSESVSDAEDLWINGNEKRIAEMLAEAYIDRFGQAAATSLREVAADYREDVDLPPVLQE